MKMRQAIAVLFAIFLFIVPACRKTPEVLSSRYPWPVSGVAAADSAMLRLHDIIGRSGSLALLARRIDELAAESRRHPDNLLLATRTSYWRARYLFKVNRFGAACDTLRAAISRLDSATQSYDFFKLRSELERTEADGALRFRLAQENVDYFLGVGDSLSAAHSLLSLGLICLKAADSVSAADAFSRAGEIWRRAGMTSNYTKNLINVALSSRDSVRNSIYRRLYGSLTMQADTAAYQLLLQNIAAAVDTPASYPYSERAIAMAGNNPRYLSRVAIHRGLLARRYLAADPRLAIEMASEAFSSGAFEADTREGIAITQVLVEGWMAVGNIDSAMWYLRHFNDAFGAEQKRALSISIESGRHAAAEARLTARISKERQQRTFLIILLVIVTVASTAMFMLYRRAKEREMRENMAAAMLRESQSRLARESVLFEQKEKLIDDLQNRIEAAAESGDLSPNRAGQILTTLKVHASGREERKAFLDIYDHLLPGLARRLKADFPTMTEGQVKLCAYIGAGMSNASIAKLLNITVQSVRTNRYRLRSRFGLAPGDSLEDFIRRYVE